MEKIAEAEEYGQVGSTVTETVNDFEKRHLDLGLVIFKADGDVAVLIHAEEAVTPGLDAVEFG